MADEEIVNTSKIDVKSYLYDRIINVTFKTSFQTQEDIGNYYTFSIINNSKDKKQEQKVYDVIRVAEGTSFVRWEDEKWVTYVGTGPTYTVQTLNDLKKGQRPDNTGWFRIGDKVKIQKPSANFPTEFCVVESPSAEKGSFYKMQGLRDNALGKRSNTGNGTSVTTNMNFTIECPPNGMKPDITFSVSMIPGQGCYKAILKIKNMCIDGVDIRTWETMEITAGYRNGDQVLFTCPIFTSYIENPNPDGVTVFEGITVGQVTNVMRDHPIVFRIGDLKDGETITLGEMLQAATQGIGSHVKLDHSLPDGPEEKAGDYTKKPIVYPTTPWLLDMPFTSGQVLYFDNSFSLLTWLRAYANDAVAQAWPGTSLGMQLINDTLKVFHINGRNKKDTKGVDEVISLDMIKGASYVGSALTVQAAWNPRLLPGDLFYMPADFYRGSALPNVLRREQFIGKGDLYRVIVMELNFSTTDSTNEMKLTALPAQQLQQFDEASVGGEMTSDEINNALTNQIRKEYGSNNYTEILLGNVPKKKDTVKSGEKNIVTDNGSLEGLMAGLLADFTSPGGGGYDCLSNLCYTYYNKYNNPANGNKPLLSSPSKGKGKDNRIFWRPKEELKQSVQDKVNYAELNSGVPGYVVFMPLVAILTYNKNKKDPRGGWDPINPKNIHIIQPKTKFLMPVLNTGYLDLANIKNIYKEACLQYRKYPDTSYRGWAEQWRVVYYLLGGEYDNDLK